jgi:hypothetical protein
MKQRKKADSDHRAGDLGSAVPRQRIVVTVGAANIHAAVEKTENRLKHLGARRITKEAHESMEIVEAEVPAKELNALLDALNSVGKVEDTAVSPNFSQGMRAVRIEIRINP